MTDTADRCGDGVAAETAGGSLVKCSACEFWQPHIGGGLNPLDRPDEPLKWWNGAGALRATRAVSVNLSRASGFLVRDPCG